QQCVTTVYADGSGYVPLARIEHGRWEKTVTAEQVDYFHTDVNGLPEELTGADGRILWRARYRTWGGLAEEDWDRGREWSGGRHRPAQNLRFQGQYHDAGTGLQYNTFRYYDPDAGRFTSQDPIGLAGGLNLYQYAPEPLSWIDPWGWMPWPWNPEGMGHHLVPRGKANSIGLDSLGTERDTPTFFPEPYEAGMHEELHRAIRRDVGKLQGPWTGTSEELFFATSKGLDNVAHIKGTLRVPSSGEILAENVTPKEAHEKLLEWHKSNNGSICK
ncbi:MAG: hypothetical protein F8N37_19330, partial [Telmatospirillum sp.]|nr:hypothetical protein [Telmatospirillum sp.]